MKKWEINYKQLRHKWLFAYIIKPLQLNLLPSFPLNPACKGRHDRGCQHLPNTKKTTDGAPGGWWDSPYLAWACLTLPPAQGELKEVRWCISREIIRFISHPISAWWAGGSRMGCWGSAISEELRAGGQGELHSASPILALGQPCSILVERDGVGCNIVLSTY